jgi:hypothetical protein
MALTEFQREICRILARQRLASGESYVAGGSALNELTGGSRLSRDIDLFHDTREALAATWDADRKALESSRHSIEVIRERPAFVEAIIRRGRDSVLLQWTHDSAFRFFPLVEHPDLGLTLHPFDLATNKVLALAGRVEARDWIDTIQCDGAVQPFGFLAWASSGKDPGMSPSAILEHASRFSHFSQIEIDSLDFDGGRPDLAALSNHWREMITAAREIVAALPDEEVGRCVLAGDGLFRGDVDQLRVSLAEGEIVFHSGSIRGAFPRILN